MQKFLWLQLRDHPTKRQTDEPNAHELLLLVTAKNRGSHCEEAVSSESGQSMLEKDIFEMQIVRSWFKDGLRVKASGAPLILFHFFFFFFLVWSLLGCFMHATLQERRAKRDDLTQEKTAFFGGGNTAARKRLLAGLKCAGLLDLQSSRAHLRSQRAHMTYTHINTMYDSRAVVDEPREREREKKKKIHYSDDWLCCRMGRPWAAVLFLQLKEDLRGRRCATATVRTYSFKSPTPDLQITPTSRHSKKPSQLILRQFTQDNVTLHTRKPRRWKMCIWRAAVTYVSAVSAPSTHRRALNPSLNTVNAVRYREVQRIPNPFHHL